MDSGIPRDSGLAKSVWSDADFEQMGWHDATIHALAVQTDETRSRLLIDLDYIVSWVDPVPPEKWYKFWICPATLVFDDAWDLKGDLDFDRSVTDMEIADLHRVPPDADTHDQPDWLVGDMRHADRPIRRDQPLWHIEGRAFDLKFRASGFHQYLRRAPVLASRQWLSHPERGGLAFTESGFQ